ncbi:MAG: hypothetical protein EBV01_15290, partial [Betaproteobacteria bacterium]|nr:hypothetical protein [Betaproteobacteria bacterium]
GKWRNTGHNDVLLGQSTGYDLFVNHIWTKDSIRALQVRPLLWASDGWPLVGEPITQYPSAAATALPGSWVHQTGWSNTLSITYASNGTFSTSAGSSGTWQTNSGRLTLNWSGGPAQELTLHPDGNSYVGRAADDSDIRGWRVPATPAGTNGSYNLASRWQGGAIPGAADVAIVEDDGTLSMSATDPDWSVLDIRIGSSMGSLGAMTQTGGRVTQGGWMRIGINGTGSLDLSGGTNQVAGFITVGENLKRGISHAAGELQRGGGHLHRSRGDGNAQRGGGDHECDGKWLGRFSDRKLAEHQLDGQRHGESARGYRQRQQDLHGGWFWKRDAEYQRGKLEPECRESLCRGEGGFHVPWSWGGQPERGNLELLVRFRAGRDLQPERRNAVGRR